LPALPVVPAARQEPIGTFKAALLEESWKRRELLHLAQLYGHLIDRTGRLYYPGGSRPVCSVQTAQEMVRSGVLVQRWKIRSHAGGATRAGAYRRQV